MKNAILRRILTKLTACAVITGLVVTAPGLRCYEALANTIAAVKPVSVGTVGGGSVGASLGSMGTTLSPMGLAASPGSMGLLRTSLPALKSPQVTAAAQTGAPMGSPMTAATASPARAPASALQTNLQGSAALPAIRPAAASAARAAVANGASAKIAPTKTSPAAIAVQSGRIRDIRSAAAASRNVDGIRTGKVRPFAALRSLFDGRGVSASVSPTPASASLGARPSGLRPAGADAVKSSKKEPALQKGAETKAKPRFWAPFTLAVAGAVGAFFGAPYLLSFVGTSLPLWFSAHPILTKVIITSFGGLVGAGAAQFDLWRNLPGRILSGAASAAKTTFRFWARFGRIWDAVLTGRSTDDAMKAPLPLNLFKYPVLAWPFVLIGYGTAPLLIAGAMAYFQLPVTSYLLVGAAVIFGGAPVAFALGLGYYMVETPVRAMMRGLKQIVVGFFPWVQDVLAFLGRVIRKGIPFLGGFFWGIIRAGGVGIGVGAMNLARPVFEHVVAADYKIAESYNYEEKGRLTRLPALVGLRLLQLGGLIATAVTGIVGGALGLLLSIPYMIAHAIETALDFADLEGGTKKLFDAWREALEDERGLGDLSDYGFEHYKDRHQDITVSNGFNRLLNTTAQAVYLAAAVAAMAVTAYIRSWVRAVRFVRKGETSSRGEKPGYERERTEDEDEAKIPALARSGFFRPFAIGLLGSALGGGAAFHFFASGLALLSMPALIIIGSGALIGGLAGLAVSQPKAWSGYFSSIVRNAKDSAVRSFRAWARAGLNTDAGLRDAHRDPKLYEETPGNIAKYPWLARPAVALGYLGAALSFVAGGLFRAVTVPVQAAWLGFLSMIEQFLPFFKRVLRTVWRMVRGFFPFVFGLVWGAVKGFFIPIGLGAAFLAKPVFEGTLDVDYEWKSLGGLIAVRAVQAVSIVAGLAAGAIGLVVGMVYGIPYAVMTALSTAFRWGDVGGRSEAFFRIWEKETLRREADLLENLTELEFPSQPKDDISYWQGFIRAVNLLTYAAVATISTFFVAAAAYVRSIDEAARYAKLRDPDKGKYEVAEEIAESLKGVPGFVGADTWGRGTIQLTFKTRADIEAALKAGTVSREMRGYRMEFYAEDTGEYVEPAAAQAVQGKEAADAKAAPAPEKKGSAVAALILGLLGLGAGFLGGVFYLMPFVGLTGWMNLAGLVGTTVAGGILGLAVSQPGAWRGFGKTLKGSLSESLKGTDSFWSNLGRKMSGYFRGGKDGGGLLAFPFKALGKVLMVPWAVIGFAHGISVTPLRAAARGLGRIAESIMPWLKRLANFLWDLAKEFFPFVFGMIVGLILGVFGTALFGAMLVGRPWFKYVVAEDYDKRSIGNFLAVAALKAVATVAGVVFGVIGLAAGVLAAIPYSLTLMFSVAFDISEIKGKIAKFFELWAKGALRTEMWRVNQLTNKFEFNEERRNGRLSPGAGWIRMANILAATLAASFAATIATYISYFRSIWRAGKDLRSGKEIDEGADWDDMYVARRAARAGRKGGSKWLSRIVGVGGIIAGITMLVKSFWAGGILSALWKSVVLGLLSWPAGWLAGLILGGVIGFGVGLVIWLARQLEKRPPGVEATPKE